MSIELSWMNPFRPADWRWRAAVNLVSSSGRLTRNHNDPEFSRAVRYLRLQRKPLPLSSAEALLAKDPGLYWALHIKSASTPDYVVMRDELQARILANDQYDRICRRIPVSQNTVETYESMFFDVRRRLRQTSFILHHIIGPHVHKGGLMAKDYRAIWMIFGFYTGPYVLDMLVDTFNSTLRPDSPDALPAFVRETITNDLMRQALVVGKTFNVNAFSQSDIMEFFAKITQMEKTGEAASSGRDSMLKNIDMMMQGLGKIWTVGADVDAAKGLHYDKQAVEFRSDELLAISAGTMSDVLPAEAALLEYPKSASADKQTGV